MSQFSCKLKIAEPLKAKIGMTTGLSLAHRWPHFMSQQVSREGNYYSPHKYLYFVTTISLQGATDREPVHSSALARNSNQSFLYNAQKTSYQVFPKTVTVRVTIRLTIVKHSRGPVTEPAESLILLTGSVFTYKLFFIGHPFQKCEEKAFHKE